MANKIIVKRTNIQGKAPTFEEMLTGELASNIIDGKIFLCGDNEVFEFEDIKKIKSKINAKIIALG